MSQPTNTEWEIARKLYGLTRDNIFEAALDSFNKAVLPGYDRHSYGIILANPEQIQDHGFMQYETFPSSNVVGDYGIPLHDKNIKTYLRQIRTKEGVTLVEIDEGYAHVVKNGIRLPFAEMDEIQREFGANDIGEITDRLGLNEEVGGKTLALLLMSSKKPDISLARLDGRNYLLKQGKMYDLEMGTKGLENPKQLAINPA